jgi:hypothetical protein
MVAPLTLTTIKTIIFRMNLLVVVVDQGRQEVTVAETTILMRTVHMDALLAVVVDQGRQEVMVAETTILRRTVHMDALLAVVVDQGRQEDMAAITTTSIPLPSIMRSSTTITAVVKVAATMATLFPTLGRTRAVSRTRTLTKTTWSAHINPCMAARASKVADDPRDSPMMKIRSELAPRCKR